jgi:hypothetical protein
MLGVAWRVCVMPGPQIRARMSLDDTYYKRYFYKGGCMLEAFKAELNKEDNNKN